MATNYSSSQAANASEMPSQDRYAAAPLLTSARREMLFARAAPTEVLPRGMPPASLAGQLRMLELQRDNLNREIERLKRQVAEK